MIKLLNKIDQLGILCILFIKTIGDAAILLYHALSSRFLFENRCSLLLKKIYASGVLSLFIIIAAGLFVGMILSFQGYTVFSRVESESMIGQFVALCLSRELAPVITALLFAGRSGSAMTAELGLMKSSQQLASMEMIGVDPIKYVISPMLWGSFISMPLLFLIFCIVGIYGGAFVAIYCLNISASAFWSEMQSVVSINGDICNGLIKSICFGVIVAWISVFQGWSCLPTAEGVGKATTKSVVYSSLAILGLDFILTALMFGDI